MQATLIRHDTKAWKAQVWISFFTAAMLCATGLAFLPGRDLDRAFMMMGYVFCVSAAFALAKFIRDNERRRVDTPLWNLVVWAGFALAVALTGWGATRRHVDLRGVRIRMNASPSNRSIPTESSIMTTSPVRRIAAAIVFALALCSTTHAQSTISDASVLSTLPIAVSVAAPVVVLSAGAVLTVVSVEATSVGAVWVLERASDGARASVRLAGRGIAGASVAAGTAVAVTAISTGWVLSAASEAIAFIPNEIGAALLYNERITR